MFLIDGMQHSLRRKIFFENHQDALEKLIANMPLHFFENKDCMVVAISFNGLEFASKLAEIIKSPLEFLFSSLIFAPNNQECIIAVTTETHDIIMNNALVHSFGISLDYIYGEAKRQYEEKILPLIYQYRKGKKITPLKDKRVLLVDEGINTGLRALASVKSVTALQARSVHFATPVAPLDVAERMNKVTDGVFCLYQTDKFVDIPYYYKEYKITELSVIEEIFKKCGVDSPHQSRIKDIK